VQLNVFRKGFNYSQDGPGHRLVYHLQGCNMACGWCSNPEGMVPGADPDRDPGLFPAVAWEVEALAMEARRCLPLFYDGGGVTLTGGEATVQFEAVKLLLGRLKADGIHTAMESNASHPRLQDLFPLVDYLILDCKHYDDSKHRAATGIGNGGIKGNLEKAFELHANLLVRIPLIRGVNDSVDDAVRFAAWFRRFHTGHAAFEFLPYHEYGRRMWERIGRPYRIENGFVDGKIVAAFEAIFQASGLEVIHT
jgi:pyruvate formate lyase activating enzyme